MSERGDDAGAARPSFQRQVWFWLGILAVLLVALYVFSGILLPFVAGMALAYLLDPVADWFERRGFSRLAATLIILVLFLILFVILLVALVPALINQLFGLIERLPELVGQLQEMIRPLLEGELAQSLGIDSEQVRSSLFSFVDEGASWMLTILGSIWNGGVALVAILSLLVVTPVVAFYLLYDWDRMIARVDSWLPREHAPTIRELGGQMSRAIAGFVRGQGLVCLILAVFYSVALVAIGLNFGLLIGLGAGLLSFIPFVGTLVGFVASVGVAAVQFWPDWVWIAVTAGIFIIGQVLEGYFLQPRLVGNSVGLHPVWLMFALFAFGVLFGFVGALIAVPVAAVIAVLVRFALYRYLASPYYSGGAPPPAGGTPAP
ncbi:MAG: AI-2E family transporter [Bauldia sp.]|nr:AI-2E family transporter [Bauldia sp.]